jgi:nitroreductase
MSKLPRGEDHRSADHEIESLFVRRWSPRAMSGDSLETEEIMRLFEAARWAPSTYNEQEWRFLYARRRDGGHWDRFFRLLADGNQAWCGQAALLGCVLSHEVFEKNGKPNPVHVFDSGLAYMSLALQGSEMGLVVHGMQGFDADSARDVLAVPDDYSVNAMFAVGRPGDPDALPESHRKLEKPSGRKPVEQIACEGPFDF